MVSLFGSTVSQAQSLNLRSSNYHCVEQPSFVKSSPGLLEESHSFIVREVEGFTHRPANDRLHAGFGKINDMFSEGGDILTISGYPVSFGKFVNYR